MTRRIEFSSHVSNLALVRVFVREFLSDVPLSEAERHFVVLGIDEACSNVIRHAYGGSDGNHMAVKMRFQPGKLTVLLRDHAPWWNPEEFPKVNSPAEPRAGGMGLPLIGKIFDSINYQRRKKGTELMLVKKLEKARRSEQRAKVVRANSGRVEKG